MDDEAFFGAVEIELFARFKQRDRIHQKIVGDMFAQRLYFYVLTVGAHLKCVDEARFIGEAEIAGCKLFFVVVLEEAFLRVDFAFSELLPEGRSPS